MAVSQHADPMAEVFDFARQAAEKSIVNAEALLSALESGDLDASKSAYQQLRPEYEQIEHLYLVFSDTDK
jgi:iron uptake system EfeUOB component EfeO/EfeM